MICLKYRRLSAWRREEEMEVVRYGKGDGCENKDPREKPKDLEGMGLRGKNAVVGIGEKQKYEYVALEEHRQWVRSNA